jgi:hypothetical protein
MTEVSNKPCTEVSNKPCTEVSNKPCTEVRNKPWLYNVQYVALIHKQNLGKMGCLTSVHGLLLTSVHGLLLNVKHYLSYKLLLR